MVLLNFLKTLNNDYGSLIQSIIFIFVLIVAWIQLSDLKKNSKGNVINQIVSNNRELLAIKLKNNVLLEGKSEKDIYFIMLLNHSANAYVQHEMNIISEGWWKALVIDMKDTFNKDDFRAMWIDVKKYYSDNFQKFMDTKILK